MVFSLLTRFSFLIFSFRNAFKETLCGRERINSTYAARTEAINIQNNGLNEQNGLNRKSLNNQNGQHQQGFQEDVHRISSASEVVKVSETVVLLNGVGTTRKLSKTLSMNKATNLAEKFEDCFNGTKYVLFVKLIVLSCSMHALYSKSFHSAKSTRPKSTKLYSTCRNPPTVFHPARMFSARPKSTQHQI